MTDEEKEQLILDHYEYIKSVAYRECRRRGILDEYDYVFAELSLGLVEAANSFNPHRGVGFKTWLFWYIQRAMRAIILFLTWTKRSTKGALFRPILVRDEVSFDDGDILLRRQNLQFTTIDYEEEVARKEIRDIIFNTHALDSREKKVLRQVYYEDAALKDIGKELAVSKERTQQICKRAESIVRLLLQGEPEESVIRMTKKGHRGRAKKIPQAANM